MRDSQQGSFRLLYASYDSFLDPCSSAGVNARDLLSLLHGRGWSCRAYTGPALSFENGLTLQNLLNDPRHRALVGPEAKVIPCQGGPTTSALVELNVNGVPATVFDAASLRPSQLPGRSDGYLFLAHFERLLNEFKPDILLTHGDHWLTGEIMAASKRLKIPVVFWLHQFFYEHGDVFRLADVLLAPSEFVKVGVRDSLRLECQALPPPLDWARRVSAQGERKYVTFVNPNPEKGVFVFAAIVRELHRLRPQIPFLVVEGRGRQSWLPTCGLDLDKLGTVFGAAASSDPREFLSVSRLVLMPSLADESFGRVAAEAMASGVPVLASRRGGLINCLAHAGFLLDVPAQYTPQTRTVPSAEEVAPWVETILRLWDDAALYQRESERCRVAAQAWRPEVLAPLYDDLLTKVAVAAGRQVSRENGAADSSFRVQDMQRVRNDKSGGPRLLFSSFHCLLDPSSGATHSARDLMTLLTGKGWNCRIFSGSQLDFEDGRTFQQLLADEAYRPQLNLLASRPGANRAIPFTLHDFVHAGIPATVFDAPGIRPYQIPSLQEGAAFVEQFQRVLDEFHPDVVVTYGSYPATAESIARVKDAGAAAVFWLRNCAYEEVDVFRQVDAIIVPSRFTSDFYQKKLGIRCTPIPSPFVWDRVQCDQIEGKYVTFVNPQPNKGVYVFARIAVEISKRRPDIPFLVVEGRTKHRGLLQTGLDLDAMGNIFGMAHTPDPRAFYRVSKIVLVPSLWNDTFPRVAAEAMLNGIPVLGTRRGGLPELLAEAGFALDVPIKYTPQTDKMPTAKELAPWIDTIIRLWDDAAFYEKERQRCRAAAEAWRPEKLAARYDEFLKGLVKR